MDFPLRSQPNLAPADLAQFDILHAGHHHPLGQQEYGPHGINGAIAFTPQAQIPGGHFASTGVRKGEFWFKELKDLRSKSSIGLDSRSN